MYEWRTPIFYASSVGSWHGWRPLPTSMKKRFIYPRHWLCSWLFSEETLWVACEMLFLEVLDNNNNNEIIIIIINNNNNNSNNNSNNNNNNSKYLFASSIFTMALCAID